MKVMISGATGFVGRAVASELIAGNNQVTVLLRREIDINSKAQKLLIEDFLSNPALARDYDVFIHIAGLAHVKSSVNQSIDEAMYIANTKLTADFAELVFRHSAARFVFLSSMAVYGKDSSPYAITEESQAIPQTPYGHSKLEAEQAISVLSSIYGGTYVVVRPPLVYGANAPANFGLLNRLSQISVPLPFGNATAKRSNIGVRNLAAFLRLVAEHPAARQQTFVIADEVPDSLRALVNALRHGNGRLLPIPILLLEVAMKIIGKRKMAQQLFSPLFVDSAKARKELGWQPIYNFDQNMLPLPDL